MKKCAKKTLAFLLSAAMMASTFTTPVTALADTTSSTAESSAETGDVAIVSADLLDAADEMAEIEQSKQANAFDGSIESTILLAMLNGETEVDVSAYEVSAKDAEAAAATALGEVNSEDDVDVNVETEGSKASTVVLNLDPRTEAVIKAINEMPASMSSATEADPEVEAVTAENANEGEEQTEATQATETPATETPATETPATEAPATETPATETPATETPATETPATETPATEAPATEATESQTQSETTEDDPSDLAGLTIKEKQMLLAAYQDLVDYKEENADYFGVEVPFDSYRNSEENPFVAVLSMVYIYYDATEYTVTDDDGNTSTVSGYYMLSMLGGGSGDPVTVTLEDGTTQERTYMDANALYVMLKAFDLSNQYGVAFFGSEIKADQEGCMQAIEDAEKAAGSDLTYIQKLLIINDYISNHVTIEMDYLMKAQGLAVKDDSEDPYLTQVEQDLEQNHSDEVPEAYRETIAEGVVNMWKTDVIGSLGRGTGLCVSLVNAFNYMVQVLNDDIYKNSDGSWKDYTEINYVKSTDADGNVTYTANIDESAAVVDMAMTTINAFATVYGQTQSAESSHYMSVVKVDGKWYFVDTNYGDSYTMDMLQNRGEANGNIHHMFFLMCQDDLENLFGSMLTALDSLETNCSDDTYEHTWFSYASGPVTAGDTGFYYSYNSTDTFEMLNSSSSMSSDQTTSYAIAYRPFGTDDTSTDFTKLIEFSDVSSSSDEDTEIYAKVYNPSTGEYTQSDELSAAWGEMLQDMQIYPDVEPSATYYDGKVYFSLHNYIFSYDVKTGDVVKVEEINKIMGQRDDTMAVAAEAFTETTDESEADITVENHPIFAIAVVDDNLDVTVATNYALISSPNRRYFAQCMNSDTSSACDGQYGYEFEETDYNADFVNLKQSAADYWEYLKDYQETNDNMEFEFCANIYKKIALSDLTGTHTYEEVSVPATCGKNAFTENRCTTCGAIEDGTRVEEEGTALEHDYVKFDETYYHTEDWDDVAMDADPTAVDWVTGTSYVCTRCLKAEDLSDEGTEPDASLINNHNYIPTEWTWSDDNTTCTVTAECDNCSTALLDCTVTQEIEYTTTQDAEISYETTGYCDDENGLDSTYTATVTFGGKDYTQDKHVTAGKADHEVVAVEAKAATCTEDGNIAYYYCDKCGKMGSDSTLSGDITMDDVKIAATGHSISKVEAKASTCTEAGNIEYYTCANCGTNYSDAEGTTEITDVALELDPENHSYPTDDICEWCHTPKKSNITGAANNETGIVFQYSEVKGASSYTVLRRAQGTDEKVAIATINAEDAGFTDGKATYVDETAENATTYAYYIQTNCDEYGTSSIGKSATKRRIEQPVLTSISNTADGVKIKWNKITGVNYYTVYRSTNGGEFKSLGSTESGSVVSFVDTTAKNGKVYTYKIRGVKKTTQNKYYSAYSATLTTERLTTPVIKSVSNSAAGKATVTLKSKNSKATGYQVVYATNSKFTSNKATKTITSNATLTKTLTGLTKGKTYYVKVRSYVKTDSGKYYSAYSDVISVKITK